MMTVTGVGTCLPGEPVSNELLASVFGLNARWLDLMTGNTSRYYCRTLTGEPSDGEPVPAGTGELAVEAALGALKDAGVTPAEIDFAVLATASPDELMPATVNRVIDALGVNDIPAIQVTSGCAGALQALYVAQALIGAGHGTGLVIGADTCRQLWPSATSVEQMHPSEVINFAMFGDGAGAVVVDSDPSAAGLRVDDLFVRTVGQGREPGQVVRWYGAEGAPRVADDRGGSSREPMAAEDYKAIESEVPQAARVIVEELLRRSGWTLPEVDLVLPPQLNGVMTERIRVGLGVSESQAVSCVSETGNNGNALPFIQLGRAVERLRTDSSTGSRRVLVCAVESSKWIHSGMALTEVAR